MLTIIANRKQALVCDDRRKTIREVTRKEALKLVEDERHTWTNRELLYNTRDFYLDCGYRKVSR